MDKEIYRNKLMTIFHMDVLVGLMNFWRTVEEKEYDFKIFVSKKAYVLYKVCKPLFDFNVYQDCIKITDTAIPIYLHKMKNASVLVIDDVFIHGRAMARIQGQLCGTVQELEFYTFIKNDKHGEAQDKSADKCEKNTIYNLSLKEKLNMASLTIRENDVKSYMVCNEYQWKRISDLIMKSLWGMNMPYASYLPIFNMRKMNRIFETDIVNHGKSFKSYSSPSQELLGQHFSYYIEKSAKNNALIHYCYVISKNDFMKDCKITPIVFFDCENTSIDKRFILDGIRIIYKSKADEVFNYFLRGRKRGNELVTLLKYLIFSTSYLATKRFLSKNKLTDEEYYVDFENAEYSFGQDVKAYLTILENADEREILEAIENCVIRSLPDETRKKKDLEEREKLLAGLEEAYVEVQACGGEKDYPKIINVLSRYFKFNNRFRESIIYKRKPSGEKYVTGLRFSDIKEFLEAKEFNTEDIIFGLMCRYNQGAATIDFLNDYDIDRQLVGMNMYWRAGEQSYKCISQTYVLIIYFQNIYETLFCKEVSQFLYDRLVDIAVDNYNQYSIPFSRNDLMKYSSKGDNVYNAFDIERYCVHEEYKYLGYIAKQIEQYVLRGHVEEVINKDVEGFKNNLFEFMKKCADEKILHNCSKILFGEKE